MQCEHSLFYSIATTDWGQTVLRSIGCMKGEQRYPPDKWFFQLQKSIRSNDTRGILNSQEINSNFNSNMLNFKEWVSCKWSFARLATAENGRHSCLNEWSLKATLNQSVFISLFLKSIWFSFLNDVRRYIPWNLIILVWNCRYGRQLCCCFTLRTRKAFYEDCPY